MTSLEQQLQALRQALTTGVRRVKFGEREVEFRDIAEIKLAIAAAEAELAKASKTPVIRQVRITTGKGF